jgi:hypothetical protein
MLIWVEAWLFLAAVTGIILHKFASGAIDIGEAQLSRAQLLISVIAAAAYYLAMVRPETGKLPDLPPAAITTLGGSYLIYLANKLAQLWPTIAGSNHNR